MTNTLIEMEQVGVANSARDRLSIEIERGLPRLLRDRMSFGKRGAGKSRFFGSLLQRVIQKAENLAVWVVP